MGYIIDFDFVWILIVLLIYLAVIRILKLMHVKLNIDYFFFGIFIAYMIA